MARFVARNSWRSGPLSDFRGAILCAQIHVIGAAAAILMALGLLFWRMPFNGGGGDRATTPEAAAVAGAIVSHRTAIAGRTQMTCGGVPLKERVHFDGQ